jgi:putative spermidine/putrescine transport system substrate-binding protein
MSISKELLARRRFLQLSAFVGAGAVIAACGAKAPEAPATEATAAPTAEATMAPEATATVAATMAPEATATAAPTAEPALPAAPAPGPLSAADVGGMDGLIAKAKAEGELNVIALPHDWLNYGEVISSFTKKYGIKINELNPDAGSGDEVAAIKANAGNTGPQAPDVIDVGFAFGPASKEAKLLQPYKVSTWSEIPDSLKDADGFWYGAYYGVLAIAVNKDVVKASPATWADLLKADYKGQFALTGDPRSSNQAIQTIYAAAQSNGGSLDDAKPGLDFFAKLKESGTLIETMGSSALFTQGETPIMPMWSYLALGLRDTTAGNPEVDVVIPEPVFGGVYVQGISAYAPHPHAARLWQEHLYSDEVQLIWAKAYGIPTRFAAMLSAKKVPADVLKKIPSADLMAKAVFPSVDQLTASKKVITEQWDTIVKMEIKKKA